MSVRCFRYHKGTDFQANHNFLTYLFIKRRLFQIPQRYRFSSKSQLKWKRYRLNLGCFRYHKGTDFQANHNRQFDILILSIAVLDTTKVQIFKQITTSSSANILRGWLFQIPQRYRFSSKSQRILCNCSASRSCFRYHKGTDFQANHNPLHEPYGQLHVVLDTTKVHIVYTHNAETC